MVTDEDRFNIKELEDENLMSDLAPFVREFAPDHSHVVEAALRHEDVHIGDLEKMINVMVEKLLPYYEPEGKMSNAKMAHLHNMLVALGRQL